MKKLVLLSLLVLAFVRCSDDDVPIFFFETLPVSNITGIPEVFVVGESTIIDLSYLSPSSCHAFEGFEIEAINANTSNIAILTRVVEGRATCVDLVNEEFSASFSFTPIETGEVSLNFLNGVDGDGAPIFITFNVPVIE